MISKEWVIYIYEVAIKLLTFNSQCVGITLLTFKTQFDKGGDKTFATIGFQNYASH